MLVPNATPVSTPNIRQLEEYYNISYMVVSLVFLSPLVGYVMAALVNNKLHETFGQRGVSLIAPPFRLVAYIIACMHPPYPVLVVAYIFAGIANGLGEAAWNTYIGNMNNSNEILGLLHGVYGVGAVISPLIATNLITKAHVPWYSFYFFMVHPVGLCPGPGKTLMTTDRNLGNRSNCLPSVLLEIHWPVVQENPLRRCRF